MLLSTLRNHGVAAVTSFTAKVCVSRGSFSSPIPLIPTNGGATTEVSPVLTSASFEPYGRARASSILLPSREASASASAAAPAAAAPAEQTHPPHQQYQYQQVMVDKVAKTNNRNNNRNDNNNNDNNNKYMNNLMMAAAEQASRAFRQSLADPLAKRAVSVETSPNKSSITLNWADGASSLFHHGWLYRVCGCPRCKQPHSGQILHSPENIPVKPIPKRVWLEDNGDHLLVEWDPHHTSKLCTSWLRNNRYDDVAIAQRRVQAMPAPLLREASKVPILSFESVMRTEEGQCEWLSTLADSGAAIVAGAPVEEKTVAALACRTGKPMETIYGTTWHVRAEEVPINIAYSTVGLCLHMDLVYYESPPALQFLHCMRFDKEVEGGDSILLDYFAAAEQLRATNPTAFRTLCELPASFQKVHYAREHPVHLVNRRPLIWVDPKTDDVVGGLWAPPFEAPPMLSSSNMERFFDAYAAFAKIIEDPESPLRLSFRLNPGEILTFSNRRMLHGRTPFVQHPGAVRNLEGCYVAAEDFISTLQRTSLKVKGKTNDTGLMLGSYLP